MLSFNRKVQYPLKPIFREYITKCMNQYIQSENKINSSLLIMNDPFKCTEPSACADIPYSSSTWIGGFLFLSISIGIYLLGSQKK